MKIKFIISKIDDKIKVLHYTPYSLQEEDHYARQK